MFGLYDTRDDCWIGDDSGPMKYDDFTQARLVAMVISSQIGDSLGARIEAREIADDQFNFKDEIAVKRSAFKALRILEGRRSWLTLQNARRKVHPR